MTKQEIGNQENLSGVESERDSEVEVCIGCAAVYPEIVHDGSEHRGRHQHAPNQEALPQERVQVATGR